MQQNRHILDTTKQQVADDVSKLGEKVIHAVRRSIACLENRDAEYCGQVVQKDAEINRIWKGLEQDCLVAVASHQPVATDLRDIVAAMRITNELERIGDYAADIAKSVLQMDEGDLQQVGLGRVVEMAATCGDMLTGVMFAFAERDADQARKAAGMDDSLDQAQQELVAVLFKAMQGQPALVGNASRMLWITHNLERCGDRATNIAEQVVFMVEAQEVSLD